MNVPLAAGLAAALVLGRWGRARRQRRLLERCDRLYDEWLARTSPDPERLRDELESLGGLVAEAIRAAPVDRGRLSFVDSTDRHPYLSAGAIGVVENFLAPRERVQRDFRDLLEEALAHYRSVERAALDPRAWFRELLMLPREVLDYVGLYDERSARLVTWLQLLWWLGLAVAAGGLVLRLVGG